MTVGYNIKGHTIIVDEESLPLLKQYAWQIHKYGYAYINFYISPTKDKKIYLHRLIMGISDVSGKTLKIDHRNRNTKDNRSCNLRIATHSQNMCNRAKVNKPCKSKFIGIEKIERINRVYFKAAVKLNQRKIYLGNYPSEEEAALAYNAGAIKYFGEFANLNVL
jgi:hypothetical protein